MKKLASLLLALVMILSCIPAMAAGEPTSPDEPTYPGSITIENAVMNTEYTVYRMLELESFSDSTPSINDGGNYSYKIPSDWEWFFKTGEGKNYVQLDTTNNYVIGFTGDEEDVAAFAKAALEFASTNLVGRTVTYAGGGALVINNLPLGYYLIDSTQGTLCSLDTTNPTANISEKNEKPELTKEVKEDSTGEYGTSNDAEIGQVVEYKATVTVQKGAENYVLHDCMTAGLTFNNDVKVALADGTPVAASNYTVGACTDTVHWNGMETWDNCVFKLAFNNDYIASLEPGTDLIVTYSATLNENAVVGVANFVNDNSIKLIYGDVSKPGYTPTSKTKTYTWNAKIFKYTGPEESEQSLWTALPGAKFILYREEFTGDVATNYYAKFDANGKITGWTTDRTQADELVSGTDGYIEISGLDSSDTYLLEETEAPAGYNKLTAPVEIVVAEAVKDEFGSMTFEVQTTNIRNSTGVELPETGGMGTTILYVGGGILVLAAIVMLIAKRRAAAE